MFDAFGATLLLLVGILGATPLIVKLVPNLEPTAKIIAPAEGYFGVAAFAIGVYAFIHALTISWVARVAPVSWFTTLAGSLLQLSIGLILGLDLATSLTITKDVNAVHRVREVFAKFLKFRTAFGVAAIVLALWAYIVGITGLII